MKIYGMEGGMYGVPQTIKHSTKISISESVNIYHELKIKIDWPMLIK